MTLRTIRRRLRALFSRDHLERELDDEVRMHLQLEADDLMRTRGLGREEAERQAKLRFGGVDRHVESHRDARGIRWLEDGVADLRYAGRALRRSPTFTLATVVVLGLGIGASTAIYSAVNAVIVARLPFPDDDRLVRVYNQTSPTNRWGLSVVDVRFIEQNSRVFSSFGAMAIRRSPVSFAGGEAVQAWTTPSTAGMFTTLGLRAVAGRVILRADEDPAAPPVVVVTDAFARRAFGHAPGAVGKEVDIDGRKVTVVGVLAPGVVNFGGFRTDLIPAWQPAAPTRRGPFGIVGIGRLKDGTTVDAARVDGEDLGKRIFPIWSTTGTGAVPTYAVTPLREVVIGSAPRTLWMFVAAAALLLLTAITNVTNLMLARMTAREREISLRAVLGASRSRLARLVAAETTLLAGIGAAFGVVLGWGFLKILQLIAASMPRLGSATIDWRAVAFAALVGMITALAVGVHPIIQLMRRGSESNLGGREVGQARHASRLRGALVAVEFALALPLLAGAGQLIDSISRLQRVDPGFDTQGLGYVTATLPTARYEDREAIAEYWRRAMIEARSVPGVVSVAYSTELPPDQVGNTNNFSVADSPLPPGGEEPQTPWITVSPGFFETMGVRLVAGRSFVATDTGGGNQALIVSESWARRYSPDRPVLGRRVFEGGCTAQTCPPLYIVGVVGDVKYQGLAGNGEAAYWSSTMVMFRGGVLMIRTQGATEPVLARVRARLAALDPGVPYDAAGTMDAHVFGTVAAPRHWAMLLSGFALVSLALAAVGTFGLLSYLVSMSWREIGVRVALGAERGAISRMIVRRGVMQSLAGVVAGLAIAIAGRRVLEASLFEAEPGDPLTLAAVVVLLIVVAALAAWLPARRAGRIEPMAAIRSD